MPRYAMGVSGSPVALGGGAPYAGPTPQVAPAPALPTGGRLGGTSLGQIANTAATGAPIQLNPSLGRLASQAPAAAAPAGSPYPGIPSDFYNQFMAGQPQWYQDAI